MSQMLCVHQTTWLASGVVAVELRDPTGAALPGWEPGAHLSLRLPNGMVREYSLCGDPAETDRWIVAVRHDESSRGGSAWVHQRLTAGTVIEVDGPRNNFPLEPARRYVLLAGGIGITPLLPMVRRLAEEGADWRLLYCGRTRESMAFCRQLGEIGGDRVEVHADRERGGPPDITAALGEVTAGALVYCCGPEPLIQTVAETLSDRSVLRVERFHAPEQPEPVTAGNGFDVVCQGTGQRVHVDPDTSVLDALAREGLDVPSSCREGVCGTCETGVLYGEPDHRDGVLSDAEKQAGDTMLICVSRCHSNELVLDLP